MIDINSTLIAQILNFLILVAILRAVAYKPIVKVMQARSKKIQESIDQADMDRRSAENLLAENKAKLAAAGKKADEIIEKAEKEASVLREERIEATKREIEQMKKAAAEEIERDRLKMQENLKSEVVALSMAAAGKIIEKNLSEKDNEGIIKSFIDKLDEKKLGDL
ncbi:MAG: F0F1 ATP synthase subunit B [Selenomonadaceae bacterium]|nr:F0F1 ATP synthase subunit B [Selenomonadaceae bacterium]MBP3723609.1 F0F1 ATP synthase subunit B [Selenomonadaceae bacterium]